LKPQRLYTYFKERPAGRLKMALTQSRNHAHHPALEGQLGAGWVEPKLKKSDCCDRRGKSVRQLAREFGASQWMIARLEPCGAQKLGPTENLFHVTLLHQFKELRSARWKSIDSKYVRAGVEF
jgi:hypothetical protein